MSSKATALAETPADSGLTASCLLQAIQPFERVVDRRYTTGVLQGVRLWASNGKLHISGTDLDSQLTVAVPYDGVPFKTLVRFQSLRAALEAFGDETPLFAVSKEKLHLSKAQTSVSIDTFDPDDFAAAELGRVKADVQFEIDRGVLLRCLSACRPAICNEETRYYLCGVSLKHVGDCLEFAATDGHRLHLAKAHLELIIEMPQVILPTNAVRALIALLEEPCEDPVAVEISRSRAVFLIGDDIVFETKPIDGTYPDYSRVIPDHDADIASLAFDVAEMLTALKAIDRIQTAKIDRAALDLKACSLIYKSEDGTAFERGINGTIEGEPPVAVGLHPKKLTQMLGVRPNGQAVAFFTDAASPVRVEFTDDNSFVGVLMPMRLR